MFERFSLFDSTFRPFLLLIFFGGFINFVFCMSLPNNLLCKEVFADVNRLTQKNNLEFIVIRGSFDEKNNISVYPLYTVRDARLNPPDGHGPYTVELQGAAGSLLASYAFGAQMMTIIQTDGSDRQVGSGLFGFQIPFDDRAQKLVIREGSKVIWNVTRSPNVPVVSIREPIEGATISGKINFEWTGFDTDGDTLFYLLEYSEDRGSTWEPLSGLMKEVSIALDTAILSSSQSTMLCVVCTDGFNTTRSIVNVVISTSLKILNTLPNDKDTDVTLKPYLYVLFGSNVKESSINEKTFLLLEKGVNAVAGKVSYIDNIMRATFVPENRLKPNTSYTARIVAGIEDAAGNKLGADYEWAFTTGSMYNE